MVNILRNLVLTLATINRRRFFRGILIMRNNHFTNPLTRNWWQFTGRCQLPLLSRSFLSETTFRYIDATLAQLPLLAEARSRVSTDTNLTISIKRLLTTASNCWESRPPIKVLVVLFIVPILTANKFVVSVFLLGFQPLSFQRLGDF